MRKLIMALGILLLAGSVWGATFYVDTASSGGDGTTQATSGPNAAFARLSAVSGKVAGYAAGDSILLRRGCAWNEYLTIPSSGSDGNPITIGAYGDGAVPIINGGTESYAIGLSAKRYIIIENLDVRGGVRLGGIILTDGSDNNIIRSNLVSSTHNASALGAITLLNGASHNTVTGNTISYCTVGITVSGSGGGAASYNIISYNDVTTFDDYGIAVSIGASDNIIEHNSVHDGATVDDRAAVGSFRPGTGNIYRYNRAYNNGSATVRSTGFWVDGDADANIGRVKFHHNIAYNNSFGGFAATGQGHEFYNNTSYQNDSFNSDYTAELTLFSAGTGHAANCLIKNNIFIGKKKFLINVSSPADANGHVIDYNCWYGGNSNPFLWSGMAYNFANFKAATTHDAHSINADPLLTFEYKLSVGSPAIDKGITVFTPAQFMDFLGNTTVYGARPDLGAIEFVPKPAPVRNLRILEPGVH